MARSPSGTDLDGLNDGQLRDLIQNAKAALAERIQGRLDEFKAMAREAGFEVSIHRVGKAAMPGRNRQGAGGQAAAGDRRGPVAPKYRNPKNAAQTWAGRGIKPKWLEQELAGGAKLEDFLIEKLEA
jgi:DNA-binding protein H-NS